MPRCGTLVWGRTARHPWPHSWSSVWKKNCGQESAKSLQGRSQEGWGCPSLSFALRGDLPCFCPALGSTPPTASPCLLRRWEGGRSQRSPPGSSSISPRSLDSPGLCSVHLNLKLGRGAGGGAKLQRWRSSLRWLGASLALGSGFVRFSLSQRLGGSRCGPLLLHLCMCIRLRLGRIFTWVWDGAHLSCPTLCSPKDGSPLGSSVHGIFQARILERGAVPSSGGSSPPRDWTRVSCASFSPALAGGFFITSAT